MECFQTARGVVNICHDVAELTRQVAERFVHLAMASVEVNNRFVVALSGGTTPKNLYSLLSQKEFSERIPWDKVHFFWGDERCVAHDHPESNYGMVEDALLSHVAIPETNVHATMGQELDPSGAAFDYERQLKDFFGLSHQAVPQFDLVLLGLGPDGHTASLFPGTEALKESKRLVMSVFVEKFNSYRLTITLPVINQARHVFFLIEGTGKEEILYQVFETTPPQFPAQFVMPIPGSLEWWVDALSAEKLYRKIMESGISIRQ